MRTILAALDADAACRPVLEIARRLGEASDATVEAVHVQTDHAMTPELLAIRDDVPLRLLEGAVEPELLGAIADHAVIAAVLGARAVPAGRRPVGGTALRMIEGANKPVVVVPPEAAATSAHPLARLLVPLEGTSASSRAVADSLATLIVTPVELVVLHVFTDETMPRMLDRPVRDLQLVGDEFLARHFADATQIDLRTGSVPHSVADACRDGDVDLIVLSWAQDSSPGHAAVIRAVLERTTLPVLLLPVVDAAVDQDPQHAGSDLTEPPARR